MTQQNSKFTPSASMPRTWWMILAAVHSMTEQRIKTTHVNIQQFLGHKFSSSQLCGIVNKGLLIKDKNDHVIYGLTDLAYEFLHEYSHCVTSEQDAKNLGFYHQTLQINMTIRKVAA